MTEPRSSPTVRRRTLSATLRNLRTAADLTVTEVERRLEWSVGKVSRMEGGKWKRLDPRDVRDLLDLYGITDPEQRDRLITITKQARERGWWSAYHDMVSEEYSTYIGLEQGAAELLVVNPSIVPGLLQTEDYARAVIARGPAELSAKQVEKRVEIRTVRQQLLTRDEDPLRVWAVMDEAALRREVGGPDVTRDQLRYLLEVAELAKVTLQVIPFGAGAHPGVVGGFTIMKFPDGDPDAVSVETQAGQLFIETPEEMDPYRVAFQHLQATALSPTDSLRLIAASTATQP